MEGYLNLFKLISAIHINGIKDTKHTISIDGEKEFNKIHSLFLKKKKSQQTGEKDTSLI